MELPLKFFIYNSCVCVCNFNIFDHAYVLQFGSGFSVTDTYNQQTQFPPVQQLQDSSSLESQALATSFHQQSLLPVAGSEPADVVGVHRGHQPVDAPAWLSLLRTCPREGPCRLLITLRLPCHLWKLQCSVHRVFISPENILILLKDVVAMTCCTFSV